MKCPECEYDMSVKNRKPTRGSSGKAYDMTQFHCQRDDVWIELEVPHEEDAK